MNTPQQQNQPDHVPGEGIPPHPHQPMHGESRQMPQDIPQQHPIPPNSQSSQQQVNIPQGSMPPHSQPPIQGQPRQMPQSAPQQPTRPMCPQQGQLSRPPYPGPQPSQQQARLPQGGMPAQSHPPAERQLQQMPRQQNIPGLQQTRPPHPQQAARPVIPSNNGMDDYIGMTQTGKAAAAGFMEKEFVPTLLDAYAIAVKNALSIVIAILLWVLTIWIPYINIGTTIALCTMPLALSRNKPISPTFIFDKRYRQFFGEFFLTGGLMLAGVLAGALFCGFPAIVILISWSLAPLLVLDKGCNASEALTLSNKYTYGNKFLIFILFLALLVSLGVILGILAAILGAIAEALSFIAILLAVILIPATGVGLIAAIYKRLIYQTSTPS